MNVLILGIRGLAGAAIADTLRLDGHAVSGTCRTPALNDNRDFAVAQFDLSQPQSIVPILEKINPDAVISCLRGDFNRQLEAHRFAADFLRQRNGMFVYLSTANVFDGDLSCPHYENDPLFSDSSYGQFKIACEHLLQTRLGNNCVILRPPEIWGKSCPRLQALLQSIREEKAIQTYENLSVNYTTDAQIAQWTAFILRHDLRGVFHVGTQDTSDYTAFLDRLTSLLDLPHPIYRIEQNSTPAYQAVLSGRKDIPVHLQLTVDNVLTYLSTNPAM